MHQYIGKEVKIQIDRNNKPLYFSARITDVDKTHISFIDREAKEYTFKKQDITQMRTI